MLLIDTHTHLYDESFDDDRKEMIERAVQAGVHKMYLPNCDSSTIEAMLKVEAEFPAHCFAMMGIHPFYVKENYLQELKNAEEWLSKRPFCAVGEIGLDYHWDKTFVKEQQIAFRQQIEWALAYKYPIVIHMREATQDCVSIVKEYISRGLKGVFHCFSGSYETAMQITEMGFYLGIGGVLTYKKAGLQEVVQKIDLRHLVLETDAPYLTPVPHRGKRNESAYTKIVAEKLAELKSMDLNEVASITSKNAIDLFGM